MNQSKEVLSTSQRSQEKTAGEETVGLTEPLSLSEVIRLKKTQGFKTAVVLPTLNEAATIGHILDTWKPLQEKGLVDEMFIVDSGSTDSTRKEVEGRGCRFYSSSELLSKMGIPEEISGKGVNIWLGQYISDADILVFADSDMQNPKTETLHHLLSPVIADRKTMLVKSIFTRDTQAPGGDMMAGGRVTKLTAAPLMQVLFPEFQAIAQPLNGNIAIRRSAIETAAMGLKYQADLQILIETGLKYGRETITQVHCGSFKQDGQDLNSLERMANQYVRVIFKSAQKSGRLVLPGGVPDHFIQHMIEPAGVIKTTKHPVDEILLPPALATGDYREKFKTHITAIRHAPTAENESGIIQGRQDTDIKESALSQYFNQIGLDRLEKPDVVVISGLKRTRQTSDVICIIKGWNDIPVVVDRRLDERNWGEFQGMSRDQLRSRYSNIDEIMEGQDTKFRPSGGETAGEVEARANESFADLRRIYPGRKVMLVGHAAALSSLGLRPDTASHVWVDRTSDSEYKLHRQEF